MDGSMATHFATTIGLPYHTKVIKVDKFSNVDKEAVTVVTMTLWPPSWVRNMG